MERVYIFEEGIASLFVCLLYSHTPSRPIHSLRESQHANISSTVPTHHKMFRSSCDSRRHPSDTLILLSPFATVPVPQPSLYTALVSLPLVRCTRGFMSMHRPRRDPWSSPSLESFVRRHWELLSFVGVGLACIFARAVFRLLAFVWRLCTWQVPSCPSE